MKILVSCYACSPYKGSEPGMGWNFVKVLAEKHELHVLVESKFEDDIKKYLANDNTALKQVKFYFIRKERHKRLRKIWPPSYYWFYQKWQKDAYKFAIELDKKYNFDVVHQLNMVGYREPGYLWRMNKPFVWGPIGGFNITPWCLMGTMAIKGRIFYTMRNLINLWQMHTSKRVKAAMKATNALITATQDTKDACLKIYGKDSVIVPEVGYTGTKPLADKVKDEGVLKIAWSGQFTHGKSLNLLIDSLMQVKSDVELHLLGKGECGRAWKKQAQGLPKNVKVIWHGWVERNEAIQIMGHSDIFCITSLSDLTSTVLLEALSYGLPVIALDHCGFSNVITDKCGVKIPIESKQQVVSDYAKAIEKFAENRTMLTEMQKAAYERAIEYNWPNKAEKVDEMYSKAIIDFKS